ncbi:MAG: glucose-6-phosphate isomerase [Spirochaetes bacterium]|nr:glucose-6-phosphate isomerase [Spirochaetota bacterium]
MNVSYKNLTATRAFATLKQLEPTPHLSTLLTPERIRSCSIPMGGGLTYNYAAKRFDSRVLDALQKLADEQQVIEKYRSLLNGEIMNTGEKRMVLHHLLRGQLGKDIYYQGKNLREFYRKEQERFYSFAEGVHQGKIRGSTGKPFTQIVQIGIGGSDLGPRALYLALKNLKEVEGQLWMKAFFLSNVDPDDASEVLSQVDPETTLFILVSKSGTTQETLTNEAFVLKRLEGLKDRGMVPKKHIVAVTSETSPMAKSSEYLEAFFIDDFIGGRYSSTSAVGGVVLSLAFGKETFEELLEGAHEEDVRALEPNILQNASLLDALLGVYERNVLGYPCTAILPYSQALFRFPAHLQQLDMESNGKRVNRFGDPIDYPTGPVVFGEPGTNGQHSFYQLLHQGTDIVPLQFIGFLRSQRGEDIDYQGSTSQQKLNANLAAQITAFARGKESADHNREFPGNRPSSLIYGDQLTARALGALLAHYENKVMFQGFIWNINSFDQEGVQLGKTLASAALAGSKEDSVLSAYSEILGGK